MDKSTSSASKSKKLQTNLSQPQPSSRPQQSEPQKPPPPDPNDQSNSYAVQQVQERAITILSNDQLLMRYAIANDISVPQTRVYFQKVAAGFEPEPVIKEWFPFTKSG